MKEESSIHMSGDSKRAAGVLEKDGFTCVLCRGTILYTSRERGVKPLLNWLDNKVDLKGCCAADKVVGNAAAFLYVLLGVNEVYAPVMSQAAVRTLQKHGIRAFYQNEVSAIRNRDNSGFCPMEEAVKGAVTSEEALTAIRNQLSALRKA